MFCCFVSEVVFRKRKKSLFACKVGRIAGTNRWNEKGFGDDDLRVFEGVTFGFGSAARQERLFAA